jgi:hypothetical protein
MKTSSERARLVLERYKAAASPAAGDKARLLDVIQQRALRGDLPRFDIQSAAPVVPKASLIQQVWGSALGKAGVALVVVGLPALGVYESRRLQRAPVAQVVHATISEGTELPTPPQASGQASQPAEASSPPDASSLPRGRSEKSLDPTKSGGSSEPTIDEEVKLMTAAQAALRSGQPRQALHLLNEHARRFPNGKLASTRAVAHMVALCAMGRADEARSEADRFLAKNPSSPFAERVRNVCTPSREGHE